MVGGVVLCTLLLFVLDHGLRWFALAVAVIVVFICVDGLRRNKNYGRQDDD